jgi:hypothetical protein
MAQQTLEQWGNTDPGHTQKTENEISPSKKENITQICNNVFRDLLSKSGSGSALKTKRCRNTDLHKITSIQAEYYPYTNLKLTARSKKNVLKLRFSDILKGAPSNILWVAGACIIYQYFGYELEKKYKIEYNDYIHSPEIKAKTKSVRNLLAAKIVNGPKGRFFDLEECYNNINLKYFNGGLTQPTLTWSARPSKTRIGHYDSSLDTLVISKSLDKKNTPRFVIEYVLYHELLHGQFPDEFNDDRRIVHTKDFKIRERTFEKYIEAKDWLKTRV